MNCLEARRVFGAFWRRSLDQEARLSLLNHLAGCIHCDQSFRRFALTAPVLHGKPGTLGTQAPVTIEREIIFERSGRRAFPWRALGGAFAFAAIGAAALCFFLPPHATFEDAFAEEGRKVKIIAYTPSNQLLRRSQATQTPVGWVQNGD
jgi:hypothetical protein